MQASQDINNSEKNILLTTFSPDVKEDLELGQSDKIYHDAPSAFKDLMNETILSALINDLGPPKKFQEAIVEAVKENGKFSQQKAATLATGILAGWFSGKFYIHPAFKAIDAIATMISDHTGCPLPTILTTLFTKAAQISGAGLNGAFGIYSTQQAAQRFLGKTSKAEEFLKHYHRTFGEKVGYYSRTFFDITATIISVIPNLFFVKDTADIFWTGIPSAFSNFFPQLLGVSAISFSSLPKKRQILINYLDNELEELLKLDVNLQHEILKEIKEIEEDTQYNVDVRRKKIFFHLLNLTKSKNNNNLNNNNGIKIEKEKPATSWQKAAKYGIGGMAAAGSWGYVAYTQKEVADHFPDNKSPAAIITSALAALISLLPFLGLGYKGGSETGKGATDGKKSLTEISNPKLRKALKGLDIFVTLFSGATNFIVNVEMMGDLADLAKIAGKIKLALQLISGGIGWSSASVVNGYFAWRLIDDIILYFASHMKDENFRRLVEFVYAQRSLIGQFQTMSNESFDEILKWMFTATPVSPQTTVSKEKTDDTVEKKVTINNIEEISANKPYQPRPAYSELAKQSRAIFADRMNYTEWEDLQKDMQKVDFNLPLPPRDKVLANAVYSNGLPIGLRQRKEHCRLFSCRGKSDLSKAIEEGYDYGAIGNQLNVNAKKS